MDRGPRLQDDTVGDTLNVFRVILWLLTLRTHHSRGYPGLELCAHHPGVRGVHHPGVRGVHHPGVRVCTTLELGVYTTLVCFVALGIKPGFCAREWAFY